MTIRGGRGGSVIIVESQAPKPRTSTTSREVKVLFKKVTSIDHSSEKLRPKNLRNAHTWNIDIRTQILVSGCRSFDGEKCNLAHAVPGGGVKHHVRAPLEAIGLHNGLRVGDAGQPELELLPSSTPQVTLAFSPQNCPLQNSLQIVLYRTCQPKHTIDRA